MPKKPAPQSNFLSEEFVHSSDDEGDADGDASKTSGLSEQNQDAHSEQSEEPPQVSSSDGESGDSDDEDSDTSSSSSKRDREKDANDASQQAKKQKTSKTSSRIDSKPFKPPAGFSSVVLGTSDFASQSPRIFSDLSGKQVWHIAAPATLNIASIKELDLEAAARGDAIIVENGTGYSMQETSAKGEVLMLAADASARYEPSKVPFSRSFSLGIRSAGNSNDEPVQGIAHPSARTATSTFAAQSPGQKKPPRQQPQGLQMRYYPFGSGSAKQRTEILPLITKTTPTKKTKALPHSGSTVGERFVVADPVMAAAAHARKTPKHTPKPITFSSTRLSDEDLDMEDAPSPSKGKEAAKTGPSSSSLPAASILKPETASQAPDDTTPKKKKRKSKLVDESTL